MGANTAVPAGYFAGADPSAPRVTAATVPDGSTAVIARLSVPMRDNARRELPAGGGARRGDHWCGCVLLGVVVGTTVMRRIAAPAVTVTCVVALFRIAPKQARGPSAARARRMVRRHAFAALYVELQSRGIHAIHGHHFGIDRDKIRRPARHRRQQNDLRIGHAARARAVRSRAPLFARYGRGRDSPPAGSAELRGR